ncbi:hypothetical protein [Devosia naphthalenivorans]|uniref:hypothetical protein n=1 Tax=Devosia naphthalenivorans TaxID=2082392 RepID=UPI000D39B1FF|nr:hypothetical protein [Devosia naphthalenivorans]
MVIPAEQPFLIDPNDIDAAELPRVLAFLNHEFSRGNLMPMGALEGVVGFGRRAMEVAIRAAMDAGTVRQYPEHAEDWKSTERVAQKAVRAITELTNYMAYGKHHTSNAAPILDLLSPARQIRRIEMPNIATEQQRIEGDNLAAALLAGLDAARRVSSAAHIKHKEVASRIVNFGQVERAAFATIWAEAWLTFYGKRPSSSKGAANAFTAFLEIAWEDATGVKEAPFAASLSKAIASLPPKPMIPYYPDW